MSQIRRLLERVSRGKTFRRRLPQEFGRRPVIVSPDAALRYLSPTSYAFEQELLDVAAEWVKPGDVVWDIGSNLGVFAVAAAHIAGAGGSVLAVEADTWLASVIRRTCKLSENRDLKIDVLPVAASTEAGVARFIIAERGRASNSLADAGGRATAGEAARETQLAPTLPLDALVEVNGPPNVIKIDVEGAEMMVLQGAHKVLSDARPVIYIEIGKEHAEAAYELLSKAGYVMLNPKLPAEERKPIEKCLFNTLAMPKERVE